MSTNKPDHIENTGLSSSPSAFLIGTTIGMVAMLLLWAIILPLVLQNSFGPLLVMVVAGVSTISGGIANGFYWSNSAYHTCESLKDAMSHGDARYITLRELQEGGLFSAADVLFANTSDHGSTGTAEWDLWVDDDFRRIQDSELAGCLLRTANSMAPFLMWFPRFMSHLFSFVAGTVSLYVIVASIAYQMFSDSERIVGLLTSGPFILSHGFFVPVNPALWVPYLAIILCVAMMNGLAKYPAQVADWAMAQCLENEVRRTFIPHEGTLHLMPAKGEAPDIGFRNN